jgi:ribonuclease HII
LPDFEFEKKYHAQGFNRIVGIDEAGRGPWAGPVVAAAVMLYPQNTNGALLAELDDSKKLSAPKRDALYEALQQSADVGVGTASVEEIDTINILQATFLAMTRAVESLPNAPDFALVDGNKLPPLSCPAEAIVKGDSRSLSIAAASIIAKVTRDRIMTELGEIHPGYAWEKNKGYGTKAHQAGLEQRGVTEHHRKSYRPIINILSRADS